MASPVLDSYTKVMHGKTIKFVIWMASEMPLPTLSERTAAGMKRGLRESSLDKQYRDLFNSYLSGNRHNFIKYVREIVEPEVYKVLDNHPILIGGNPFTIYLTYSIWDKYVGQHTDESMDNLVHIVIGLNDEFITGIIKSGRDEINITLFHELIHQLDRRHGALGPKRRELIYKGRKRNIPFNIYYMNNLLSLIRTEAITSFSENVYGYQRIPFRMDSVKKLKSMYKEASENLNLHESKELYKIHDEAHLHRLGAMFTATIVVCELFTRDIKFSVWIEPRHQFFGKREINAVDIKKFYGNKDFDLVFYESEKNSAGQVVSEVMDYLIGLNYLQFLKIYKRACSKLDVVPFFSIEEYNGYKRKFLETYQKNRIVGQ